MNTLQVRNETKLKKKDDVFTKSTKRGTRTQTIVFLTENTPCTQKDLYAYLIKYSTKNEIRWASQRNRERLFFNGTSIKHGTPFTEEPATLEQYRAMNYIVENGFDQ